MKTILCYGDSITWGYDPRDGSRYPFEQRWLSPPRLRVSACKMLDAKPKTAQGLA